MRHAFLVALSFANLCYLRVWAEILTYRPYDTYLMTAPPRPVEYLALVANVVLAAAVLTGLSKLARRAMAGHQLRFGDVHTVECAALRAVQPVPAFEIAGHRIAGYARRAAVGRVPCSRRAAGGGFLP